MKLDKNMTPGEIAERLSPPYSNRDITSVKEEPLMGGFQKARQFVTTNPYCAGDAMGLFKDGWKTLSCPVKEMLLLKQELPTIIVYRLNTGEVIIYKDQENSYII